MTDEMEIFGIKKLNACSIKIMKVPLQQEKGKIFINRGGNAKKKKYFQLLT